MKKIEVGSKVPIFELKDQNGKLFNLEKVLRKKNLVIYFYPKDGSPGRVTYLVKKEGKIAYMFNSHFQAEKHVDEALRIIQEMNH